MGRKVKRTKISNNQAPEVIAEAIKIIKAEKKIIAGELCKKLKEKFGGKVITPQWLARRRITLTKSGIEKYPTTVNGKSQTVYAVKGVRKTKRCLICGKEIQLYGLSTCSEKCEKELEKIVNFYIPPPEILKYSLDEIKEKVWRN